MKGWSSVIETLMRLSMLLDNDALELYHRTSVSTCNCRQGCDVNPRRVKQRTKRDEYVALIITRCPAVVAGAPSCRLHHPARQILVHETFTCNLVASLKGHQGKIRFADSFTWIQQSRAMRTYARYSN